MALKIPDAPNVIGTQPVLREEQELTPVRENPNFKIDVSQPAQAMKDVGSAVADYVDYKTNILMGAACNQFDHDLIQEEQRLKNKYKGIQANDLYAKLEEYATGVLNDMTGAAKDDGRVRIVNPELQKRFRDWASKQMPAYQTRMMNYTASELDKANQQIIEDTIKRNNSFVMGSSMEGSKEQFDNAMETYRRAAQLSAQGMPKNYQEGAARRMMDDAVLAKMKTLSSNNVLEAIGWYVNVPSIKEYMLSQSEAVFLEEAQKDWKEQGKYWLSQEYIRGGDGMDEGGFLDDRVIETIFPRAARDVQYKARLISELQDEGMKIRDARVESEKKTKAYTNTAISSRVVATDTSNFDSIQDTVIAMAQSDPEAAKQYGASAMIGLRNQGLREKLEEEGIDTEGVYDLWTEKDVEKAEEEYDSRRARYQADMLSYYTKKTYYEKGELAEEPVMPVEPDWKQTKEQYIEEKRLKTIQDRRPVFDIKVSDEDVKAEAANTIAMYRSQGKEKEAAWAEKNPEQFAEGVKNNLMLREQQRKEALLNEYIKATQEDAKWVNSPVYKEYFMRAMNGTWNGEYAPDLDGIPVELYTNLRQINAIKGKYDIIARDSPSLDEDLHKANKNYNKRGKEVFTNYVKNNAIKLMERAKTHNNGVYPARGSAQYNNVISEAIKNATSPSESRFQTALSFEQYDMLRAKGINMYLQPKEARSYLEEQNALDIEEIMYGNFDASDDADELIDTFINAQPPAIRNRLKPARDIFIDQYKQDGSLQWISFYSDGIGGYFK